MALGLNCEQSAVITQGQVGPDFVDPLGKLPMSFSPDPISCGLQTLVRKTQVLNSCHFPLFPTPSTCAATVSFFPHTIHLCCHSYSLPHANPLCCHGYSLPHANPLCCHGSSLPHAIHLCCHGSSLPHTIHLLSP